MARDKIVRVTFSLSLAEHMLKAANAPILRIERLRFRRGRQLTKGEESASGLYCITTACGRALRVSLFAEAAAMMTDEEYRFLFECWVDQPVLSN